MEDGWMEDTAEDSRHAFLLQVRETFVGPKETSNQTSRLSIPLGREIALFYFGF